MDYVNRLLVIHQNSLVLTGVDTNGNCEISANQDTSEYNPYKHKVKGNYFYLKTPTFLSTL